MGRLPKIAAQRLQRIAFLVDLRLGAEAEAPKQRHRRAPALDGMLQQKARHDGRQREKAAIDKRSQAQADERHCGGIGLEGPFDIPLAVEIVEPPVNGRAPRGGEASDDEKNGTRFVVEADFTRLGPFQLDGLMRQQRFDLMVRSRIRLDERMRRDIEAIYEEARGLTGFAGSIAFQTVDAFPVMPLEELKQSGERA